MPLDYAHKILSFLNGDCSKLIQDTATTETASPLTQRNVDAESTDDMPTSSTKRKLDTDSTDDTPTKRARRNRTRYRAALKEVNGLFYGTEGNLVLGPPPLVAIESDDESLPLDHNFGEPTPHHTRHENEQQQHNEEGHGALHIPTANVSAASTHPATIPSTAVIVRDAARNGPEAQEGQIHQAQQVPETPNTRRWGLGSLVANVPQSVSRLLPSIARFRRGAPRPREEAVVGASENLPATVNAQHEPSPHGNVVAATPVARADEPERIAQTEPQQTTQPANIFDAPATAGPSQLQRRKDHQPKPSFQNRQQRAAAKAEKEKRLIIAKQQQIIDEEVARRVKAALERSELHEKGEKAAKPGQKRKRLPSPDVIPNPPGVSYGMDLNYFGYYSDESSDEDTPDTPTHKPRRSSGGNSDRPSKRARFSNETPHTPERQIVGDPFRAQPYNGVMFAMSDSQTYDGGNVFGQATTTEAAAVKAATSKSQSSPTNKEGTFRVPDDSDSDEDEGTEESSTPKGSNSGPSTRQPSTFNDSSKSEPHHSAGTTSSAFTGLFASQPSVSTESQNTIAAPVKAAESWTQPPPPRPNPSHAALPSSNSSTDTEALARARSQALRYTPKQPSGLRASSRLSTSTVGSDIGNEHQSWHGAEGAQTETQDQAHEQTEVQAGNWSVDNSQSDNASVQQEKGKMREYDIISGAAAATDSDPELDPAQEAEVLAEVAAIPEELLIQFNFPDCTKPVEDGSENDPEVEAALDSVCSGPEFDETSTQYFNDSFAAWKAVQAGSPTAGVAT